jgi:hypothetical protein
MATYGYEASIAADHRIFYLELSTSFTLVQNMLAPELLNYLVANKRVVLDGYAYSLDNTWRVSDKYGTDSSWYEEIPLGTKYNFPLFNWYSKVRVMSPVGGTILKVRLVVDR